MHRPRLVEKWDGQLRPRAGPARIPPGRAWPELGSGFLPTMSRNLLAGGRRRPAGHCPNRWRRRTWRTARCWCRACSRAEIRDERPARHAHEVRLGMAGAIRGPVTTVFSASRTRFPVRIDEQCAEGWLRSCPSPPSFRRHIQPSTRRASRRPRASRRRRLVSSRGVLLATSTCSGHWLKHGWCSATGRRTTTTAGDTPRSATRRQLSSYRPHPSMIDFQ